MDAGCSVQDSSQPFWDFDSGFMWQNKSLSSAMEISVNMLGTLRTPRSCASLLVLVGIALYLWQPLSSLVGSRVQVACRVVPLPRKRSEAFPQTCCSADLRKQL